MSWITHACYSWLTTWHWSRENIKFVLNVALCCVAVIGYPCGQDGAILSARDMDFVPQGKFIMFCCFIPYNKSFIDQACSVKMAGYWPRSFSRSSHKKELCRYSATLTSRLVDIPYILSCFLFWVWIISNYTKHKLWKALLCKKN